MQKTFLVLIPLAMFVAACSEKIEAQESGAAEGEAALSGPHRAASDDTAPDESGAGAEKLKMQSPVGLD